MSEGAKPKFPMLRAVWRLARPHKRQLALIVLLTLLATAVDLVEPLIYRVAVNDIAGLFVEGGDIAVQNKAAQIAAEQAEEGDDGEEAQAEPAPAPVQQKQPHQRGQVAPRTTDQTLHTLLWAVALWLALNIVSHLFHLFADQRTAEMASRIEQGVIVDTFTHALRLPLSFFSKRSSGGLTKQIDQLDQVAPIVSAFAQQLLPEVLRMLGIVAIMLTQSWKLTLLALITLPPYIIVARLSSRRLESGLDRYYETWDGITGRISDALGSIKTVKLSGAEPRETERLRKASSDAFGQYVARNALSNRYTFWQTSLTYISQAITLAYGGYLVLRHQLTPGDVVMFVAYLDKLYSPIEELSSLTISMQDNLASFQRALNLSSTPGAEVGGVALRPGAGRVEFRDVRFGYTPERTILHGLSFDLAPGKMVALVGPSGAGKTTVADLLLKLYEPGAGQVLIDGQPLSEMDASSLRAAIGVVSADGAIFRGTIADNIRYKRPEASDAEVLDAAQRAGLAATLQRLPDGLATEIGERGFGLSVGERQRVQIARVLAGRPRVLVLDEATANLDYATENEIRHALIEQPQRPTTLVIAHRYSMVRDADWVIVLDQGRIAEQGSPADLAAGSGWFARFAAGTDDDEEPVAEDAVEEELEQGDEAEEEGEEESDERS